MAAPGLPCAHAFALSNHRCPDSYAWSELDASCAMVLFADSLALCRPLSTAEAALFAASLTWSIMPSAVCRLGRKRQLKRDQPSGDLAELSAPHT